ncbi:MAG: hypothetical protein ACYCUI_07820 [Vulcanimicrobiaceae bacterium]
MGAGPRCTVCDHPQRNAIDVALAARSLRDVEGQYGTPKSALQRHKARHLGPAVARVVAAREKDAERSATRTLETLEHLLGEALDLLTLAKKGGRIGDATKAVREAHQIAVSLGRLMGEFPRDGGTVYDNRTQILAVKDLTVAELRSLAMLGSGAARTRALPVASDGAESPAIEGEAC